MKGGNQLRAAVAGLARIISGTRPQLAGWEPSDRPTVYYANHGSHLDAVVIWAMLPSGLRRRTRPVAARDYWEQNRLRRWLSEKVFRAILIDRQGAHGIAASLESMQQALQQGDSLIVFPEGTRGDGLTVGAFKPGLHHLAQQLPDVEFVPVYLQNLNRILPKGEFLPVPLLSCISFGPPLWLERGEAKLDFLARARRAVMALKE